MNHLIVVRIDKKDQFTYSDFASGEPANEVAVRKGDKVAWYVERDGKPVGYTVAFKSATPFAQKALNVQAGGLSPLTEVSGISKGVGMQYSVKLNSGLEDDPEIRIDDDPQFRGGESVRLSGAATSTPGTLVKATVGSPAKAGLGDWVLFQAAEDFTVTFAESPFSTGETTFASSGLKTASRLVSAKAGDFAYTAKFKSGKTAVGSLTIATAMVAGG